MPGSRWGDDADAGGRCVNSQALAPWETGKRLEVVAGAGHLPEEPGALEETARLACEGPARRTNT